MYAQWRGWANVLEGLKRLHPEIVIDNRLSAHGLGPWHMLAGSYDEPIAGDENPETYGIPVPSLRTDHVAADNLRRVNYWYRQGSLLPMARVPGFFGHQTDRSRGDLARPDIPMAQCENQTAGGTMPCYKRDYDLLGYKYALMSNLATAGMNVVACMLPARDENEFSLFPQADVAFIKRWLIWTDANIAALKNTVPLPGLDEVGTGLVDGTAAFEFPIACSGFEQGFVWLFNPTYTQRNVSFQLSADALSPAHPCRDNGQSAGRGDVAGAFSISQLYPTAGGPAPKAAAYNATLTFELAGSSALMLRVSKGTDAARAAAGDAPFFFSMVAGTGFPHAAQVALAPGPVVEDGNATFSGAAMVPAAVFAQLAARQKAYPVPWDARDDDASWLRPERLLLFLQLNCTTGRSGACADTMFASLSVDGAELPALKAYESRCVECTNVNHPFQPRPSARFNGYYWDVSKALKAGVAGKLELMLPSVDAPSMQGLFFENVEPQ